MDEAGSSNLPAATIFFTDSKDSPMSIYTQLQARMKQAVAEQDKPTRTSLRTVIGEIQTREKRTGDAITDGLCAKVISDAVSGNMDSLKYRESDALRAENRLLQPYLDAHNASMLSAKDIEGLLRDAGVNSLPEAMKYMKANHAGAYDGKTASTVARGLFS